MYWFIICPIRGLYDTIPDDDKASIKVIKSCREIADDIKPEGFSLDSILCIRGEKYTVSPPSKDYQLQRQHNP